MKRIAATAIGVLALLFFLPVLMLDGPARAEGKEDTPVLPALPSPAQMSKMIAEEDGKTVVRVAMEDGSITEMTMADYLWSVVAAEMPASFETEALKAQAVTARTYALWKMAVGADSHPDADVCTDINCCQAYVGRLQAAANWGDTAAANAEKVRAAVAATDGEVITYQGVPIQALFFSSADRRTEDAMAVWGNAVPYLVGVDSPEGDGVPNYRTEVMLTAAEAKKIILEQYPGADLSGTPVGWFGSRTTTASGRVASMDVGGITVSGTALRSLFGLRSTSFTVEPGKDSVTFHVTGYGHGVGMSQYGANTLAQQGKTYREILAWYYTGVEIG